MSGRGNGRCAERKKVDALRRFFARAAGLLGRLSAAARRLFPRKCAKTFRRERGDAGEKFAADFLKKRRGMKILRRNFRAGKDEIDIIARDGEALVFVEVKTLRRSGFFRPLDNLSPRQRQRNFRAGRFYWKMLRMPELRARFDLVEVVLGRWDLRTIRHWKNYLPQLPDASRRNG